MGWLKYVVAGVGGAIVGGPVGAAAAIGVVKGVSAIKDTIDDDDAKKRQIASNKQKIVTQMVNIQEKRETILAKEQERKTAVKKQVQTATIARNKVVMDNAIQDSEQNEQLVIALFAIGFAASNVDGHISKDELLQLAQFIKSIHSQNLSVSIHQKVQQYKKSPPSLHEAWDEINRLSNPDYEYFRRLINLIINADGGIPTNEEVKFLNDYNKLVAQK